MFDSDSIEAETEKTLMGLGFRRTDFERRTSEFSGGWRMRIELSREGIQLFLYSSFVSYDRTALCNSENSNSFLSGWGGVICAGR